MKSKIFETQKTTKYRREVRFVVVASPTDFDH